MNTTSPTLLHLDASPRGARSHSRRLGQKFVSSWRAAHPQSKVVTRDIGREPPPFLSEAWIEGAFSPADQHSPGAQQAIAVSDAYIAELLAADEIVITTPIYNLSIPAALKAWIDQVVRTGRTFEFKGGAFRGLATGKRAIIIVASGGDPRPNTPGSPSNFVEPYLRAVFSFIGINTVEFVYAHSLSADSTAAVAITEAESILDELVAQP
jgi:FMN-dependent NADH-azoreductase